MSTVTFNFSHTHWKQHEATRFAGVVFAQGQHQTLPAVLSMLTTAHKNGSIYEQLQNFSGTWSICTQLSPDLFFASVDRLRAYPIFYGQKNGSVIISSEAETVRQFVGDTMPTHEACEELLYSRHVIGGNTLFANVKKLQAGECLLIQKQENGAYTLYTHRWFLFSPIEPNKTKHPEMWDKDYLLQHLDDTILQAHQQLIAYANGRTIAVPLSGGLDSRTLALSLKRLQYDNIIAFSYGCSNNNDIKVAQWVASQLNIPWKGFFYSRKLWQQHSCTADFTQYLATSHNYSAAPHFQDYPAVSALVRSGFLTQDMIIAPGHTDSLVGNYVPPNTRTNYSHNFLVQHIINRFCSYKVTPPADLSCKPLVQAIVSYFPKMRAPLSYSEFSSLVEQWGWNEEFCQFYITSTASYTSFDLEFNLPLCDSKLMDFWLSVPADIKRYRQLQMAYVAKQFAEYTGCTVNSAQRTDRDREKEATGSHRVLFSQYRHLIPSWLKYLRRSILLLKDPWGWQYAYTKQEIMAAIRRNETNIDSMGARRTLHYAKNCNTIL